MRYAIAFILLAACANAADIVLYSTTATPSSAYPAPIPRTGQTTSYFANDDGATTNGVASPVPRFTIVSSGARDNLTGLIWATNANFAGLQTWTNAMLYVASTNANGGYAGQTDWRLPNLRELISLWDAGRANPCIPTGHPFVGVVNDVYWTSTTLNPANPGFAFRVGFSFPIIAYPGKSTSAYVWPVRGP